MHVHALDTDDHWYVEFNPGSISKGESTATAELTVTGTASDLYLALWNRADDSGLSIAGDRRLLDTRHQDTGARWDLD